MREIKFRGLHPSAKTIMDVCVIDWMHDEVYFEQGTDVSYSIEECKLMQYTGLKDKNGVEIYEGDIVKHASAHYDNHGNCSTKYHAASEAFIDAVDGVSFGIVQYRKCGNIEVIGNIHQNPELLD